MDQRTREILLLRYIDALESERPDVVAMVLHQAEYDFVLSQMIIDLHRDPATAKQLLRKPSSASRGQLQLVSNRRLIFFRGLPTVAALIALVLSVWLLSAIISSDDTEDTAKPQSTSSPNDCVVSEDWPSYVVQSEETVEMIASRFNIDIDELTNANCLQLSTIQEGQLLAIPLPSQAIETQGVWFGHLYDAENERIRRVSTDGLTAVYSLGVPVDERISEDGLAISLNGEVAAYCTIDNGGKTRVYLRNILLEVTLYTIELENPSQGCKITSTGFQVDGPLLAVTRISPQGQWYLDVIHLGQGNVVYSVNGQSTIVGQAGSIQGELPTVIYFDSRNWLVFAFYADDFQSATGYRWYLDRQVVEVSTSLTERLHGVYDFNFGTEDNPLTSTEAVSLDSDPDQPNVLFGANVVRQTDKTGTNVKVYHNPDAILLQVQYVYDGERVVVLERPLSNLESRDLSADSWVLIGDQPLQIASGNAVVDNAPDGLIVYANGRLEYRGDETRLLWEGNAATWEWVWSWNPHHLNRFRLSGD